MVNVKEVGAKTNTCEICKGNGILNQIQNTPFGKIQNTIRCTRCGGEGNIIVDPCKKM